MMWQLLPLLLTFVRFSSAAQTEHASQAEYCKATSFSQPGFVSSRSAFPQSSKVWNGVNKISFQNKDGTWLAGNFRDTGSDFVVAMLGGATTHKETWPLPDLAKTLADVHGLSSIAVDVTGRGESCGYEIGPDCASAVGDMAAAIHFINSLPGRFCGGLFGLGSGATASLFYAAKVANVPAIFMAEPDALQTLSMFENHVSADSMAKRLQQAQQVEITVPNKADRLIMTRASLQELLSTDLQSLVSTIPSDLHLHWYTAEHGSSLTSEMRSISFAHMKGFHHHQFPDARHDFMTQHPDDFLALVSSDIAAEALDQHAAKAYIKNHPCPKQYEPSTSAAKQAEHNSRRLSQHDKRQQRLQAMPKHFYINDQYKTSLDSGLVNPAAVELQPYGWLMIVMHYKGCFGSDCILQTERAFTPPLLARMGGGDEPDPRNISHPTMTSFNQHSWAAVTEHISAHPVGGLRFSSFRPFVYQNQLHVSYALEIFDKSLNVTAETRSDEHKMRFQGTGFAQIDLETLEINSLVNFAQPLIPRREFPCCDKNWGVLEVSGELYIFYTLLPCLTIFKLDPSQESGARFVYASCLNDDVSSWVSNSVNLEMRDVRISGHPIVWSQYPQTLLVLVHHNWRKHGGSKHWAVQMQFDPQHAQFMVSAISKDPVLDHEQYFLYNEAVLNVIAVGSYHLSGRHLRILYGDGDKYSAFADIDIASISWVTLNATSASEWTDGLSVALGDRVNSITYTEYESLVW